MEMKGLKPNIEKGFRHPITTDAFKDLAVIDFVE
jgi:hypothetical protein